MYQLPALSGLQIDLLVLRPNNELEPLAEIEAHAGHCQCVQTDDINELFTASDPILLFIRSLICHC